MPSGKQFKPLDIDKNSPNPGQDVDDYFYTTKELAGFLNVSMNSLASYRRQGVGPKYIQVGYRTCRYPKKEVLKYIEERTRTSTSNNWQKD